MRILIVKLSALGDVVQSLPLAVAIKGQMRAAQIDWLVESPSAGILVGHPALARVVVSPRQDFARGLWSGLTNANAFVGLLRGQYYDAVLDLQGLIKSAIFIFLSRGTRKIGFLGSKEPTAWALNEIMPPFDIEQHALERYLGFLEPLGLMRPALIDYGLTSTFEEAERARLLTSQGDSQGPLVLLHPVAKWDSKLWPVAHWAELAGVLARQGVLTALTGSSSDQAVTGAIRAAAGAGEQVMDLAGQTELRTLAALQARASLVISPDTGAMHLASAMGAPVLALFGPTAPGRTGPYGAGHQVLTRDLNCQPCFKRSCPKPRCMIEITPQEVAQAALVRLGRLDAK